MSRRTVYTIRNTCFYAGPNPLGVLIIFDRRRDRDDAHAELVRQAEAARLAGARSAFPCGQTTRDDDFLRRLEDAGILRANGIDAPGDGLDFVHGSIYTADDPATTERKGNR